MGGAAVAGPSMAKQALASGLEAVQVGGGFGNVAVGMASKQFYDSPIADGISTYNHADWLRERIKELTGISEADRRDRIAGMYVNTLDPDLAVNRSFSLSRKISIQKEREFDRQIEQSKRSLARELADFLKRQALS
jgi:hypothetical protein